MFLLYVIMWWVLWFVNLIVVLGSDIFCGDVINNCWKDFVGCGLVFYKIFKRIECFIVLGFVVFWIGIWVIGLMEKICLLSCVSVINNLIVMNVGKVMEICKCSRDLMCLILKVCLKWCVFSRIINYIVFSCI